jgi:hypothetical protein
MRIQMMWMGLAAMAAVAGAQGPGPVRGRGGFGPPPGEPGFQGGARLIGAQAGMPGRVVTNAPYSADVLTESTHVLADGNRIHQTNTTRVYRDSEGRTRRENSLASLGGLAPGGNLPQMVFITDPVAGVNYALNAKDRTATKSAWRGNGRNGPPDRSLAPRPADPGRQEDAIRARRALDPNLKTESLGQQSFEGVMANGTRSTYTIPAGQMGNEQAIQIVSETWYSTELQTVVMSKRTDPRSGEFVTRIMNVSRSEPSRTLFDVPVDFKVSEAAVPLRRGSPPGVAK